MDGIHDLGGMHGFGPVDVADGEPRFHAPWEGRVAGMMIWLVVNGYFNIDAFRHGIETMDPVDYLSFPYFGRWRHTVEKNLIAGGWFTREELEERRRGLRVDPEAARRVRPGSRPGKPKPAPGEAGFVRRIDASPRFRAGDAVRAKRFHPPGHTRLPRYARGKRGRVERVHPAFVFPDAHAHGQGEQPQYLYSVRFDGRELWDGDAEPASSVAIDLFESYLEPAETDA